MAIVKATYTKKPSGAKASIRYMQHRKGAENEKANRILFGLDGAMGRWQAYDMIERAEKSSFFYRFVISPDPHTEDREKDIFLREITEQTLHQLSERIHHKISWVAVEHDDHAPHRHVHVLAIVPARLQVQDFQAMRQEATTTCLEQRHQRDLLREQQRQRGDETQWELQR